jgi:hypothetical protein
MFVLKSLNIVCVMPVFLSYFRILLSCVFGIVAEDEHKIMSPPQALLKLILAVLNAIAMINLGWPLLPVEC